MKRLLLFVVAVLILALAVGCAVWAFWPPHDDREIAWLYPATNTTSWQRFVTAIHNARDQLRESQSRLVLHVDDSRAFPDRTTDIPEIVVWAEGTKGKLRFRWYKLTSNRTNRDWVKTLVQRDRAPLAIIGGSSSDTAIEVAQELEKRKQVTDVPPLLLLTTATTDEFEEPGQMPVALSKIYNGYTFRFCFTNRKMAHAVIDFIRQQDDLRPDADPSYLTIWADDKYSQNLGRRFNEAMWWPTLRAMTGQWGWAAGAAAGGGPPIDLTLLRGRQFYQMRAPITDFIPYSVGTFDQPNRREAEVARRLGERISNHPNQKRPLLLLPAVAQPARRFLRALMHNVSLEGGPRIVVATGDAIPFNIVYRDRRVAWPIQDLPFHLVFFCHRNPVDSTVGFQEEADASEQDKWSDLRSARVTDPANTTGTEDLLLYMDIVETIVQASLTTSTGTSRESLPISGEELKFRLREARMKNGRISFFPDGRRLFDERGDRRGRTGEHIVCVRPQMENGRLLPRSTVEVWTRRPNEYSGNPWRLVKRLQASYADNNEP